VAESSSKQPKKRVLKRAETVREKSIKAAEPKKQRRLRPAVQKAKKPFSKAAKIGKKEYYLPLPDNKVGRFLNKRRSIIPKYFKEAWLEMRQVQWPNRKETIRLSTAVLLFALIFGIIITVVDYGLDKLFKQLLT
jgi:preprotein translocase SecE subunit